MTSVLLVDDHELWRDHVRSSLGRDARWRIVGEVTDGLDAVVRAEALKPDVIVLDVGLPTFNGIEAARRILAHDPNAKILFLSEHSSWDIAEAALVTGARGYVVKSDAGWELLPAVEAVAAGKRFVSWRLGGRIVKRTQQELHRAPHHEAGFYPSEHAVVEAYARFVTAALAAGSACIVVAPDSRRNELHERLQACGVNLDLAIKEGRYSWMDLADALSSFMVDGWPDEDRFWKAGASLILGAARTSRADTPHVAACGECAPSLWREGKGEAAIRLEQLWDELALTYNLDVFCPYLSQVPCQDEDGALQELCEVHSAVHSG